MIFSFDLILYLALLIFSWPLTASWDLFPSTQCLRRLWPYVPLPKSHDQISQRQGLRIYFVTWKAPANPHSSCNVTVRREHCLKKAYGSRPLHPILKEHHSGGRFHRAKAQMPGIHWTARGRLSWLVWGRKTPQLGYVPCLERRFSDRQRNGIRITWDSLTSPRGSDELDSSWWWASKK